MIKIKNRSKNIVKSVEKTMSKEIFINFLEKNRVFNEFKKEVLVQNKFANDNFDSVTEEALSYADCDTLRDTILENGTLFFYDDSTNRGKWNNLNIEWKRICNECK